MTMAIVRALAQSATADRVERVFSNRGYAAERVVATTGAANAGAHPIVVIAAAFEAMRITVELRTRPEPAYGHIVVLSFEPRRVLERQPDGGVLDTVGVTFVRLPVGADALAALAAGLQPLAPDKAAAIRQSLLTQRLARLRHRAGSALTMPRAAAMLVERLAASGATNAALYARALAGLRGAWPALRPAVAACLDALASSLAANALVADLDRLAAMDDAVPQAELAARIKLAIDDLLGSHRG